MAVVGIGVTGDGESVRRAAGPIDLIRPRLGFLRNRLQLATAKRVDDSLLLWGDPLRQPLPGPAQVEVVTLSLLEMEGQVIVGVESFVFRGARQGRFASRVADPQLSGQALTALFVDEPEGHPDHSRGKLLGGLRVAVAHVDRVDVVDRRIPDQRKRKRCPFVADSVNRMHSLVALRSRGATGKPSSVELLARWLGRACKVPSLIPDLDPRVIPAVI